MRSTLTITTTSALQKKGNTPPPTSEAEKLTAFFGKEAENTDKLPSKELARIAMKNGWTSAKLMQIAKQIRAECKATSTACSFAYIANQRDSANLVTVGFFHSPNNYQGIYINLACKANHPLLKSGIWENVIKHEVRHLRQRKFYVDLAASINRPILTKTLTGLTFHGGISPIVLSFFHAKMHEDQNDPSLYKTIAHQKKVVRDTLRKHIFRGSKLLASEFFASDLLEVADWAVASPQELDPINFQQFITMLGIEKQGKIRRIWSVALIQSIIDGHKLGITHPDFERTKNQAVADAAERKTRGATPVNLYDTFYQIFTYQFKVAQQYLPE